MVKDEKCDLVTDSHSILTSWRNDFSQLFNVHGINDVRPIESLVLLRLRWLLKSYKDTNHQVSIKSQLD